MEVVLQNTLDNVELNKYQTAAAICDDAFLSDIEVLKQVAGKVVAGALVADLCQFGDELILSYTNSVYNKQRVEKGIAVPTTIGVNNIVQNFSPLPAEPHTINVGDLVKIELGVHIDGYVASSAHTTIVNPNPQAPVTGRASDAICAAYFGLEAAMRTLKVGNKNTDVMKVISDAAAVFGCSPVEGTVSSQVKRFLLNGNKTILNYSEEHNVEEYVFEENEVYTLNIFMSTGEGKVNELEHKPTIYQRDVNQSYSLKLKAARALFNHINETFSVFPFPIRMVEDARLRLGLQECVNHQLLTPYPIYTEKRGEYVAQFKLTVVLTPKGPQRLTSLPALPYIHSDYTVPENSELKQILAAPVKSYNLPPLPTPKTNDSSAMDMS
ncbi:Creatinase/aminopeptidase [Basidiobolus meristosporus CBS 931.73]|uniref:Creatinase/aminopeptidase n=1 Tax=Basidiobolus meristosporus CBS 931.73 TaxID=1314790 RepID=A0A1Y1Y6E7_9FUNG|nr:Creatinase/aminopeptidase [Basidiobolus meristosporus CBS 931.73]|eukprot:ORX93563.1 Creatinase/aminopeptidase [Basidiobolus meristosporus CBS 931.73]